MVNYNTNKITEYDEAIYFHHSHSVFRKYKYAGDVPNFFEYPLLINNEYILSTGSGTPIEDDQNISEASGEKEILKTVRLRVKQFTENDINFRQLFLDNLKTYSERIGLENTVDLIIPVLAKIVCKIFSENIKY